MMTQIEFVPLGFSDILVLVVFFAVILLIGVRYIHAKGKILDFLVGGRSLTLPVFVLTLFSTWYGGILGIGEFGFTYGISTWILQGVPYYIFACAFALIFAKHARRSKVVTIPDQLEKIYGKKAAYLGAFFTGILSCPAPYILMFGVLLQVVTGWSLLVCVLIGIISSLFYLWFGGFKADVATDVFFGIVMIFGFMVILPFLFSKYGGYSFLEQNLPPLHLKWHGGNSAQFIIMWFFIALWTFIEPTFYQRCYAAKSEDVAIKGIIISIVFWFLFDLMTITAALYSKAIFHDLNQPMLAYPLLANLVLPPFWKGLFFAGMFATILSTLNSQLFVSGMSLGRDLIWKWTGQSERTEIQWIRFGMVLSSSLCVWILFKIPSVVKLWYSVGTVIVPGLLIAMVSTFFPRMRVSTSWILGVMLSGFSVSLFCLTWGWWDEVGAYDRFPFGLEPMFPGLFVSILIWFIGLLFVRKIPRGEL